MPCCPPPCCHQPPPTYPPRFPSDTSSQISKLADFAFGGGRNRNGCFGNNMSNGSLPQPQHSTQPGQIMRRIPGLPPCAATCITTSDKPKDMPAQRLRNVDVLEELCYYVPGGDPGNMDCYAVDEYGNVEKICDPCCCEPDGYCPPQPVKYSRRQRFTFNDPNEGKPASRDPWPFDGGDSNEGVLGTYGYGGGPGGYGGGGSPGGYSGSPGGRNGYGTNSSQGSSYSSGPSSAQSTKDKYRPACTNDKNTPASAASGKNTATSTNGKSTPNETKDEDTSKGANGKKNRKKDANDPDDNNHTNRNGNQIMMCHPCCYAGGQGGGRRGGRKNYTYMPEEPIDICDMLPARSGNYYFDQTRKVFIPEEEIPKPPQIIEKQVTVPDVEEYELLEEEKARPPTPKPTVQPVIQPIIMPSGGPCSPQPQCVPCMPPSFAPPCYPPPCPPPLNPYPPPCNPYPPPCNPYPPPCNPYPPPCNPCPPPCNPCPPPCNPCPPTCNPCPLPCNPCPPPCNSCNNCAPCNPCNPCMPCGPMNPLMNMGGGVLPMVIPMCPQQPAAAFGGAMPMMPPPPPFPFPPFMDRKKRRRRRRSRSESLGGHYYGSSEGRGGYSYGPGGSGYAANEGDDDSWVVAVGEGTPPDAATVTEASETTGTSNRRGSLKK